MLHIYTNKYENFSCYNVLKNCTICDSVLTLKNLRATFTKFLIFNWRLTHKVIFYTYKIISIFLLTIF